jgi:DNA-binding FrmR family transcriptional regulator
MAHTISSKKPLLTRVRRIKGQVAALERALEEETECLAVLQQIAAVRGALNGLMAEVLEGHVREHLGSSDVDQATRSADTDAVVSALRSYLK